MAKRFRLVDSKMEKVLSIVAIAADEIVQASTDASTYVQTINKAISDVNQQVQEEKVTPEEAVVLVEQGAGKAQARLKNRLKKMVRNAKAINSLLVAIKAMDDDEEKDK